MPTVEEELANLGLDRSRPKQSYRFWETQPVAQFQPTTEEQKEGPIEGKKRTSDVRQEPYPLIDQFEWCLCDLQDEKVITEVYDLLRLNYVEDDDEMFRFCYSREFLRWALCPPGHKVDWHLGVRVKANQKLVRHLSACGSLLLISRFGRDILAVMDIAIAFQFICRILRSILICCNGPSCSTEARYC